MINKLKGLRARINKSNDSRTLATNFGYMMLLQIAGYIFPLLTIPYLATVIGVEGFGKIAFAAAVIVWFQTVADWGFNYTATRDVAQNRGNIEKVSEIFSNVLWARILLMVLSFGLLLLAITTIPYFQENRAILLLTFLLVPGHIMFPDWFFQAMERMKYITIFNLISKAAFTGMVFIFINDEEDFLLQPVLLSLGYLVCGIFAMYVILVKWRITISAPQWHAIRRTIKDSTDVFLNNLMQNLYNSFTVVLLGFWGGAVANGIYDAGRRFVVLAHSLMLVILRVTFPFLSRNIEKHSIFARVYLAIAAIGTLALFAIAPLLIDLFYTNEFNEAVLVLRICSTSIFFVALNKVYGINYLIIEGYAKDLRNITFVSSLLGFVVSFPLVYYFDYMGAAITLIGTQALLGLLTTLKALSVKNQTCISRNDSKL